MFQAPAQATYSDFEPFMLASEPADFRTPADPEAGWAARNPDRAMLFLFVSPRPCGAVEELIAL
jgi:hypothetical protein